MANRKAIEDQIADLQAQLEADDDDTELWVEHPKTKAVGRLRGAHAKSFLAGVLGSDDDDQDDDADDDQDDDADQKTARKTSRKPPKKPAGRRPAAGDDQDDDDDQPPARQSVWGRR